MHAVRRWDEEVIKWLAVGMVLAMVGMAVMPMAVGDAWAVGGYYLSKSGMNPEAGLAWSLSGVLVSGLYGAAAGAAFGGGVGAVVGFGIGV